MEQRSIYDIVNEEGLDEKYDDDVSRATVIFFKNKNISIKKLLEFKKEYPIIYPWDSGYNDIRVNFNRMKQFFPKMIVEISKKRDVQWILEFIKKYNIKFTIRSGGHCSNSYSLCDGIVIDTSKRNYLKFNKDNIFKVGSGIFLGSIVEQLGRKNLFLSTGSCSSVSTGLFMGGGVGIMRRKYGLSCDSMLSATLILADNTIVKADKDNYSDLFWALRGGGNGNFGVVTDLVFKSYDLSQVALFELWIPFCYFEKAVDIWQRWAPFQNNNLTAFMHLNSIKNKKMDEPIYISGQFDGKKSELKKLLKIFDGLHTSSKIWYTSMVDCEIHHFNPNPPLFYSYLNLFATEYLSLQAIKKLKKIMKKAPVTFRIEIDAMGGKISEVSKKSTAFYWRNSLFWIVMRGCSMEQEDLIEPAKWVRSTYNQLLDDGLRNPKTGLGRAYCNFKDPELTKEQYPLVYWGGNTKKLIKIKNKYDPNNVFNYAQSIPLI
jgi:hypothetical protein